MDVTNALTVIRSISNALDVSENDILWEDDGEDKDDSDWVTDSDSVMSVDGESDEQQIINIISSSPSSMD